MLNLSLVPEFVSARHFQSHVAVWPRCAAETAKKPAVVLVTSVTSGAPAFPADWVSTAASSPDWQSGDEHESNYIKIKKSCRR